MLTVHTICDAATATGDQASFNLLEAEYRTEKFSVTGSLSNTTTPAAVVSIWGSHDDVNFVWLGDLDMSGALDTDTFGSLIVYPYIRATVDSISGTSAEVTVTIALIYGSK